MASWAAYMSKLQDLTEKNLEILSLLNDSFYSKAEHVSATIDSTKYSIPSFLYIENKLNDLEGNWKRLVYAPLTGEAGFVFDGSTRRIQLEGFDNTPSPITISRDDKFYMENNDIFKDFISPLVYLKYNLAGLPDNIHQVCVRKVAFLSSALQNAISGLVGSTCTWQELSAILDGYIEDTDYILYDKVYDLPLRHSDYYGRFTVSSCTSEVTNETPYWVVKLDTLQYTYDNGSLTKLLEVDDYLTTENDECKLIVKAVDYNAKTVRLQIAAGYKRVDEGSVLKFIRNQESFDSQKYIKVPLEEDKYIAITIASVNSNLHTQSIWSDVQVINTNDLKNDADEDFRTVYDSKIRNIGDVLYDLTKFNTSTLSNVTESNLKELVDYKPIIAETDYDVVLLNEHLLDNASVETLRKLNVQKAQINNELTTIQNNIDKITNTLATTDFSTQDTTTRKELEDALANYNQQKATYVNNLNSIVNQITLNSTTTTLPTSGNKYVISGGVKYSDIENKFISTSHAKIIRIELLYRYKNINKDTSNATTVNDVITVSDWNKYIIDYRQKVAKYVDGSITYEFEENSEDSTSGRWCTYQIPITQGETVDMRLRVQYDLGYPYVSVFSDWSDIVNVEFPDDLVQNSDVQTILDNNSSDSKVVSVKKELLDDGIMDHINDKLIDQDITYFHRPDNIASGFYTEDSRRVISLKDKLADLNNQINNLKAGAFGSNYKDITVSVSTNNVNVVLTPNDTLANINLSNFNELDKYDDSELIRTATVLINIANSNSNYPINLYSMFPGPKTLNISSTQASKSKWQNILAQYQGVNMKLVNAVTINDTPTVSLSEQLLNQVVYFRTQDGFTSGTVYNYSTDAPTLDGINICPFITSIDNLQPTTSVAGDYIELNPGEAITIPIQVITKVSSGNSVKATCSFDIWDSPFHDPLTYTFTIVSNYNNSGVTKVLSDISSSPYVATTTKTTTTSKTFKSNRTLNTLE